MQRSGPSTTRRGSAGKVRFGSGSGPFFLNTELEPRVRFGHWSNREPEPAFSSVQLLGSGSGSGSNLASPARTPNLNSAFGSAIARTSNLNAAFSSVQFGFEPIFEPDPASTTWRMTNSSRSHRGAIFPGTHNFTIASGAFDNVTRTEVVFQRSGGAGARFPNVPNGRYRSAAPDASERDLWRYFSSSTRESDMTVAIYQVDAAEEVLLLKYVRSQVSKEWRRDIARYMTARHPRIMQIYAAASCDLVFDCLGNPDVLAQSPMPALSYLGICSGRLT
ncbi:hypothetical protein C8F04DRAFT_1183779 [Mycena alexandri]|uniref:Protein kinase domain-containing protein n=1 Tax=Mycena alexandri TaxID=1745969 RepID=A0AAD6SWW3_9AGAR|nr:hypothetical protein C8F04DRAFT_1183779 [Mycena alexandri]